MRWKDEDSEEQQAFEQLKALEKAVRAKSPNAPTLNDDVRNKIVCDFLLKPWQVDRFNARDRLAQRLLDQFKNSVFEKRLGGLDIDDMEKVVDYGWDVSDVDEDQ